MSTLQYWKERLDARRPIANDVYWVEEFDYKPLRDANNQPLVNTWPKAVAGAAIYSDYRAWFEDVYLVPFRLTPYFMDFPEQLPEPCEEWEFWAAMRPLIHVWGKSSLHKRTWRVWTQHKPEGGNWTKVRRTRNFLRLGTWQEHMNAYELHVNGVTPEAVKAVADTVARAQRRTDAAREAMPDGMRKA